MKKWRIFYLITVIFLHFISSSHAKEPTPNEKSKVYHLVLIWLKEPGNEGHKSQLQEATESFSKIPGVLHAGLGPALPNVRAAVDSRYDLAALIILKDHQALEVYQKHPIHQKALKEVLQPLAAKVKIYDFTQ